MSSLDMYLESRHNIEIQKQKDFYPTANFGPLLSMDLFANNYQKELLKARKKNDLNTLLELFSHYNWELDQNLLREGYYDALILTDSSQIIQWVNKGFTKMTGYSAGFAVGRSTRFLQGDNTHSETRERIKEQLGKREIFTELVINYRKNREEYKCEITIIPLLAKGQHLTHFLALEKEVA